jgi:hypothetical protein
VRYPGAAGGAEKAHSRQRRWCLWSKPVNLGTWGLVTDPIAIDSSYTRPKSNVTRASEAATSRTNSDASWTWLIYARRPRPRHERDGLRVGLG